MTELSEKQKERQLKIAAANRQLRLDRIKEYELNPAKCTTCDVSICYEKKNNKFCSKTCAARHNNIGVTRNYTCGEYANKACKHCEKITKNKFCSRECLRFYKLSKRFKVIQETGIVTGTVLTTKNTITEIKGRKCEICNLETWNDQPAPLVLDHINGNPSDQRFDNLRLVCGNCNMQLPTFAGRNVGKGGGRPYRNQRYLEGKSY